MRDLFVRCSSCSSGVGVWVAAMRCARTLDGLRAAEAQGRKGGRPFALNADTLTVARARQAKGESVTAIAKYLDIGRSTLYRALEAEISGTAS